ncbi:DUF3027 domain-containing protein [Arsenicicoccus dermatophilus]|uniref:DUF3027 domain-containing protein n=1 Tax=Arsenicicoccus dermatophilus TaxID=1076331 RepID=UPI0039175878
MATLKPDTTLCAAVDLARQAAESIAEPGMVGEHVGVAMDAERLATHRFACLAPGYPDWLWSITVTRVSRSRTVTVCETHLLPGETSVVAPAWLPYEQRIAPGDLGPGDVSPYVEEDPNLEPGFEATGEEDVDQMAQWELGLGRKRVLSAEGREVAAQRWYDGDNGPTSDVARQAPARCATCGYFVPMAGALRRSFGVCANEWSPSDGRVVSLDHGCGAHSESDLERPRPRPLDPPVVDDLAVDLEVIEPVDPEPPVAAGEAAAHGVDPVDQAAAETVAVVAAVEAVLPSEPAALAVETEADPAEVIDEAPASEAPKGVPAAEQPAEAPAARPEPPAAETPVRRGRRTARRAAGAPAGPPRTR